MSFSDALFHLPDAAEFWCDESLRPRPRLWTELEAAVYLRCSVAALRNNRSGETRLPVLAHVWRNGSVLYRPTDVREFYLEHGPRDKAPGPSPE